LPEQHDLQELLGIRLEVEQLPKQLQQGRFEGLRLIDD